MSRRAAVITSIAALAALAAGCGTNTSTTKSSVAKQPSPTAPEVNPAGDIPDNQAYVRYAPRGGAFSVKVPEGWAQSTTHGATTFTDKLNSITLQSAPASAAMTVSEAKRSASGTVSMVRRNAGTAVRIKYLADSKPDPVTGKVRRDAVERYVFFHNGRRVVLTLAGPKGADNVDPWKLVTESVSWTR